MHPVAINLFISGPADKHAAAIAPPAPRYRIHARPESGYELRSRPPGIATRVDVILSSRAAKDQSLGVSRSAPRAEPGVALRGGVSGGLDANPEAAGHGVAFPARDDFQFVRPLRQSALEKDGLLVPLGRVPALDARGLFHIIQVGIGPAAFGADATEQPDLVAGEP